METGVLWGDVATWVTGIATFLLFAGALWQINTEREARLLREKERDAHRIRGQAEHLSGWIAKETVKKQLYVAVSNQSVAPVYEVILSLVMIQGSGPHEGADTPPDERAFLSISPPGLVYAILAADYHGMNRHPGIEIAFKDGKGKNWVRKSNGDLMEIDKSPIQYYNLVPPLSWQFPVAELPKDRTVNFT